MAVARRRSLLLLQDINKCMIKSLSILESNYSRNFCNESSILRNSDDRLEEESQSRKMTELYNKQQQYRNILTRVNGSTIYSRHSETRKIEQCKNEQDLKHLYNTMHENCNLIPKFDVYQAFMRKAMELDIISFHWQIFEELKTKFLDKDCMYHNKETAIGKLFNNAMTATLRQANDKKIGINDMFQIYDEYKMLCNDETNNWHRDLPYYPITLTRLISSCTMAGSYGRAKTIIHDIFENKRMTFEYNKTLQHKLWNSMLNYYSKTRDVDSMEMCFQKMTDEYGIKPDDVTYNIRMNAFAKEHDLRFETVFRDYIKENNRYPGEDVFVALLNGYSYRGDIESCIGVLKLLVAKNNKNNNDIMAKTLPELTFIIFVPIFKSLIQTNTLIPSEYGWQLIEYLMREMKKVNVEPTEIIYGIIFTLCGSDFFDSPSIEKLNFYYEEMTEKYQLKPQLPQLRNVLKCGIQYYQFIDNTKQKYVFVKWWKQEMDKYNVSITNQLKHILINGGCIGCL